MVDGGVSLLAHVASAAKGDMAADPGRYDAGFRPVRAQG